MKKSKNKSQYKPKNYFALPHVVLNHPDFLCLNWASQGLLIQMGGLYNGFNNGDISIAYSEMKLKGFNSAGTLDRSKNELQEYDWIRMTRQGNKYGLCHLYALSWIPLDDDSKLDMKVADFKIRIFQK